VRLLLRSPRFRVRVPISCQIDVIKQTSSRYLGRGRFNLGQLLEFNQDLSLMLREITNNPRITE